MYSLWDMCMKEKGKKQSEHKNDVVESRFGLKNDDAQAFFFLS